MKIINQTLDGFSNRLLACRSVTLWVTLRVTSCLSILWSNSKLETLPKNRRQSPKIGDTTPKSETLPQNRRHYPQKVLFGPFSGVFYHFRPIFWCFFVFFDKKHQDFWDFDPKTGQNLENGPKHYPKSRKRAEFPKILVFFVKKHQKTPENGPKMTKNTGKRPKKYFLGVVSPILGECLQKLL